MSDSNQAKRAREASRKWRFHLVRGARSLEAGEFAEARRHFEAAHGAAPDEPIVCLAWGRELLRSGEVDAAERLLRQAWDADRSLRSAGFSLVRLLGLHRGRPEAALELLDEVEALHGAGAASLLLRAEVAIADPAAYPDALDLVEEARQRGADPASLRLALARVHNAEGIARGRGGDHHQALFALKRASDLDPEWSGPLVNSGAIFERLGLGTKARVQYREALRLDPANPVALYNLAESLRRQGTAREAARLYKRLLSLQPGYPGAEHGLRRALEHGPLDE